MKRARVLQATVVSPTGSESLAQGQGEQRPEKPDAGSCASAVENGLAREDGAEALRRARRERGRARVAAKALAAERIADEQAKAAREKHMWAKRDERLMLYKQAQLARQETRELAHHEKRRPDADGKA